MSEAEARALVDAWLGAQNHADFAAYQALYAARFDGIKRVGERISRFDRAGWLKDRERMFHAPSSGSPLHVELTELSVQASASIVRVRFVQSFSKGTFSDRGPKELLLVRENKQLRIAREELLRSELTRARGAEGGGFLFVISEGVVLDPVEHHAAARGPLQRLDTGAYVVRQAVDPATIGAELRAQRERGVLLGGRPECKLQIGALWLVVRVDPHFSTVQRWSGELESDPQGEPSGKPVSDEQIAREVWEMGSPELVGELSAAPKGCDANWARDPALPIARVEAPSENVPARLRKEAERQMVAAVNRTSPASAGEEPSLSVVSVGGKEPLLVGSYTRGEGCAEEMAASFVWRLRGTPAAPRLELINEPDHSGQFTLDQAIDLDADGRWELFGNGGHQLLEPASNYGSGPENEITELDCQC